MATYCGRFDDFAAHHTNSAITSLGQLNQALLAAVLVGDDLLLINDGHMVLHPALREAVLNPDASPLRTLVEAGYVQILTRNKGQLGTLIPEMADNGITSAQALLAEPTYADKYQPALMDWTLRLSGGGFPHSFLPWPTRNTTEIFSNLVASAYDNAVDAADPSEQKQLANFRQRLDDSEGRRTDWEDIAGSLRDERKLNPSAHGALMHIANEGYQYSWGCALLESKKAIRVDTESPNYISLDLTLDPPEGQMREGVKIYVPNLELAASKVGTKWDRLAQMVIGNETKAAKQKFRKTLQKYYTSEEIDDSEMRKEARAYSRALAEHFGNTKTRELIFGGVLVNAAGTAAGAAAAGLVAGPPGALIGGGVGFAVGFVGAVSSIYWNVPQSLMRLSVRPKIDWITPENERPVSGVSSFEIDPQRAEQYLRGVSQFDPA